MNIRIDWVSGNTGYYQISKYEIDIQKNLLLLFDSKKSPYMEISLTAIIKIVGV